MADTPGHEQYTCNMITGASTADLAIILIDGTKGVLEQTRRHSFLCTLVGIKRFVLAINKMDLIKYSQERFNKIQTEYKAFANEIGINEIVSIPISGLHGDNIIKKSKKMAWYNGKTLLSYLEETDLNSKYDPDSPFLFPVQWVNRSKANFRGYAGQIISGKIAVGDKVSVLPSGINTHIRKIVTYDGNLDTADCGHSVTLVFKDEIDCARGQIITNFENSLEISDQFETTLFWMDQSPLIPGRSYHMKIGSQMISATVAEPKYKLNVTNLERLASKTLDFNSIGIANVTTDRDIAFSKYSENKHLGGFILIDKITNLTACAGIINFGLRRAQNIHWQSLDVSRQHHAKLKQQKPAVIWMTGISGAGKSTIANKVEVKLAKLGKHTFLLDGDNIRHGLNKDLGFKDQDRIENIRRVGEVAKLMTDAGLIVITAFISPFRSERSMVRSIIKAGEFLEVFIDTPLAIAESRDVKGLYKKARSGELKNFTGIDSPYEPPEKPDIHIDTTNITSDQAADTIVSELLKLMNN